MRSVYAYLSELLVAVGRRAEEIELKHQNH
jgi:hypothetical protein